MTKTLTEQWREGTLDQRYYYVQYNGNQKPFVEIELKNFLLDLVKVKDRDKIEVISAVPSYDEYKRLQEQLNEANEVIKKYATGTTQIKAKKYEGSCYITDPFTGERERIEDWGEKYDADIPMSNDDKPAKEYLKKWGVK